MEDAFILNKASFERGFAHGSVLKSEVSLPLRVASLLVMYRCAQSVMLDVVATYRSWT